MVKFFFWLSGKKCSDKQKFVRSGHLRAKYSYAQRNKLIRNLIMKLVHKIFPQIIYVQMVLDEMIGTTNL